MGNPFLLAEDYTPTATYGIVSGVHTTRDLPEGVQAFLEDVMRKLVRGHQGKIARERKQQDRIDASCRKQAQFFGSGSEELKAAIGPQDAHRMRLERDRN